LEGEPGLPGGRGQQTRRLTIVLVLTSVILIVEVAGGLLSGSLALLSDAGHMLTDLLALAVSLIACRLACLPADSRKTFGYYRLEILTALFNGALLVFVSAFLLFKAAQRFAQPQPIRGDMMTTVALVGLLANIVSIVLLSGPHRNLNLRGARMHLIGDALSSFGVVLAGIGIALTGWLWLDPIVAGILAIVIVVGALRLVREAADVLLEATPAGVDPQAVSSAIASLPGVLEVHDLHIWSITTGRNALSGHVRVGGNDGAPADELLNRIKRLVRDRFGIVHTTIQLESPAYQELGDVH
jgi:cobalt-zinc-cadmium efflux system protein